MLSSSRLDVRALLAAIAAAVALIAAAGAATATAQLAPTPLLDQIRADRKPAVAPGDTSGRRPPVTSRERQSQPSESDRPPPRRSAVRPGGGGALGISEVATGTQAREARQAAQTDQANDGDQDLLSSLGSPLCRSPRALSARTRAACERSNAPHARYAPANYNLDIDIESGGIKPGAAFNPWNGIMQALFAIAGLVWLGVISGISLAMSALQWLFSWSLLGVGSGQSSDALVSALTNVSKILDAGWMRFVYAMLAFWVIWTGLIRRRAGEAVGAFLLSLAMIVVSFWIINNPQGTVGYVARASDQATMQFIAAPNYGSLTNPQRSFGDAMYTLWDNMVTPSWCIAQFNDVKWCMQDASVEERKLAGDTGARRRADVWLSNRWGSSERGKVLQYYAGGKGFEVPGIITGATNAAGAVNPVVGAIGGALDRGDDVDDTEGAAPEKVRPIKSGSFGRLLAIAVLSFGMLGAMFFLFWLAMKLMQQVVVGALLLVATPFAALAPAFGERGRKVFSTWISTLIGTFIMKAVYAAILGIAVAVGALIFTVMSPSTRGSANAPALIAWGFIALYWWVLFLRRNWVMEILNLTPGADAGDGITLGNVYHAVALGQRATRLASTPVRAANRGRRRVVGPRGAGLSGGGSGARPGPGDLIPGAGGDGAVPDRKQARGLGFVPTPDGAAVMDQSVAAARSDLTGAAGQWGHHNVLAPAQATLTNYNNRRAQAGALRDEVKDAEGELRAPAAALAKARASRNREADKEQDADPQRLAALQDAARTRKDSRDGAKAKLQQLRQQAREVNAELQAIEPDAQAARGTLASARRNHAATGSAFTPGELEQFSQRMTSGPGSVHSPAADPQGAWRAGMSPQEFGALKRAPQGSAQHMRYLGAVKTVEQFQTQAVQALRVNGGHALSRGQAVTDATPTAKALQDIESSPRYRPDPSRGAYSRAMRNVAHH